MFYSQFILAKKGPLGTIWIAAHLERKLRKNQVADTDIGVSVDSILFPDMPIALRLSSHLLLGVVRIYSRKVNYLFDDCSDTLLKIKQAFRSTAVDLPPEESTAPYHSITLPETFDLDDFELPDNDLFQGNYVDHHVSTKEQITLQDTMDGVVYSTSQFGLDERFGDGDTSQIGLDLSEDLFLEKLANPVDAGFKIQADAETSLQSTTPYEEDEIIEEKNEDAQAMVLDASDNQDYAKAPSTPVLVEEPNLFTVQNAQTCNDHLETEDHNSLFIETVDNVGSASSKPVHHGNEYDSEKIVEENGLTLGKEIDCLKPNGDLHSVSENVEHVQNEVPSNNEAIIDIRGVGSDEKIPSPSSSPASSKENTYHKLCQGVEKIAENDQALLPQKSMNVEFSKNMEESHMSSNVRAPNAPYPLESVWPGLEMNVEDQVFVIPEDCKTLEDDGEMHSTSFNILKPCNQPKKLPLGGDNSEVPPDLPNDVEPRLHETFEIEVDIHASGLSAEIQGDECHPTTANKPFLEANVISETNLSEDIGADRSYLDAVLKEALEFPNGIAVSELSAPEKLLSVPEGSSHLLNELLVDTTPDKVAQEESEGDGPAINTISGRKRTFTESTLTTQSLDSDESFAKRQSRRTAKFIPDDDDLLSSILVGRKSSILKLKPTPNPSEAMPLKRSRTTARVSSSKRKVLMDDSMVLHGDTIRQQLMGTDDIRRVRKKAPSTRHEIWIVQKQLLEDEVFSEPIATGMSIELIDLHKQTHNLRNIVISIDENIASLDSATDAVRPSIIKENEIEGSTETPVARIETDPQSSMILVHIENQQREGNDIGSHENDPQLHMNDTSADIELKKSSHEHEKNSEIEIYGNSVEVVNAAKSTLILEQSLEFPSLDKDDSTLKGVGAFNFGEIHKDIILEFETEYGAPGEGLPNGAEDADIFELRGDSCVGPSKTIDSMELSITNMSPKIGECHDLVVASDNPPMEEIEKDEPVFIKEQEFTAIDLGCDDKNAASNNHMSCDEPKADSLYFIEDSVKDTSLESEEIASFNDFKSPSYLEAEAHGIMVLEETGIGHHVIEDHGDMEETIIEHDTDFLNVDDDDQAEDDDYLPNAEETRFLENSGWSSRSRAVANYLKTLFDKEAQLGKNVIPMDNLLSGKTRKEASRMFFETLVLKTRDYIHVEQHNPYDNINIKPRGKLMKSDF